MFFFNLGYRSFVIVKRKKKKNHNSHFIWKEDFISAVEKVLKIRMELIQKPQKTKGKLKIILNCFWVLTEFMILFLLYLSFLSIWGCSTAEASVKEVREKGRVNKVLNFALWSTGVKHGIFCISSWLRENGTVFLQATLAQLFIPFRKKSQNTSVKGSSLPLPIPSKTVCFLSTPVPFRNYGDCLLPWRKRGASALWLLGGSDARC